MTTRREFIQKIGMVGISLAAAPLLVGRMPRISMPSQGITEFLERPSFTAKHFDLGGGFCKMDAHIGHIHYQDGPLKDGSFQDIDTVLNYNTISKSYQMTAASYEAEIGLYGDILYSNVDHSMKFTLPNPAKVEARAYNGSEWGKQGKALIWRDIIQDGGHQIVEARNNSLAKIFHFDQKPLSNQITFNVLPSAGLRLFEESVEYNLAVSSVSIAGKQATFYKNGGSKISWIRKPQAWNHRGETVDVQLRFSMVSVQLKATKTIPQDFIDKTFTEAGAWLECDTTTSFYVGSGDGWYRRSAVDELFGTIRSGAQTAFNTSANLQVQAQTNSTFSHYQLNDRTVIPVDTSSIGGGQSISAASWYLYCLDKTQNLATMNLVIDVYTTAGYPIANYAGVRQASDTAPGSISLVDYTAISLNATGLTNVNKTGTSLFALRSDWDFDNNPPTWGDSLYSRIIFYPSEGANPPYLSVTYSAAGASPHRKRPTIVIY